jgi:predicted Rossmann fold nucleotide-binding protein DprA/Smf involved in DNA uptake
MAVKKAEKVERAKREVRIAAPEETGDVRFRESGAGMVSMYRDLLEDLQDAPRGSTLKIARTARYTALKHIRTLGLKVLWGKKGEDLYIKIVGSADEVERPLTITTAVKEAAAAAARPTVATVERKNSLEETIILQALAQGPLTAKELSRMVGASLTSVAGTLSRMVGHKQIENEDGVYRRRAA